MAQLLELQDREQHSMASLAEVQIGEKRWSWRRQYVIQAQGPIRMGDVVSAASAEAGRKC